MKTTITFLLCLVCCNAMSQVEKAKGVFDREEIYAKSKPITIITDDIRESLGDFNLTRRVGKITQLVGLLLSGAGIIQKDPNLIGFGAGVGVSGLVVDLKASDYLKKYEK
jgi:hypothetical protein